MGMIFLNIIVVIIMLATGLAAIIVSVFPGLTVKFLQTLLFYRKGSLSYEYIEHVTSTGYRSKRCRYYYKTKDGYKNTENAKVWLIMIVLFSCVLVGAFLITFTKIG
jgi:uncharacterized membrane protein YbaN (DUF454 family)